MVMVASRSTRPLTLSDMFDKAERSFSGRQEKREGRTSKYDKNRAGWKPEVNGDSSSMRILLVLPMFALRKNAE
jgi:hypothetical protein